MPRGQGVVPQNDFPNEYQCPEGRVLFPRMILVPRLILANVNEWESPPFFIAFTTILVIITQILNIEL